MTTLTARENEIRDMADALNVAIGKAKIQRMARRLAARDGALEVSQFWLVYGHTDPTPAKALRNIGRNPK